MQQIMFAGSENDINSTDTEYNRIQTGGKNWNASETPVEQVIPAAGTFKNLSILLNTAPGSGSSYAFTLRLNGADTDLVTTVSDTDKSAINETDEVSVSAGDTVAIKVVPTNTPNVGDASWSFIFIPDTGNETILLGADYDAPKINGNDYNLLQGGSTWNSTALAGQRKSMVPTGGTLKDFYVQLDTAPDTGKSYTFTVYLNGSATGVTLTISDTATTGSDLSNTVAVVAGDTVAIKCAPGSTPDATRAHWGIVFDSTISGESIVMSATTSNMNDTVASYNNVCASTNNWTTDESSRRSGSNFCSLKKLYIELENNPGAAASGKQFVFTVRSGDVDGSFSDTALAVTIFEDTNTGNNTADTVNFDYNETVDFEAAPTSTPVTGDCAYGLVAFIQDQTISGDTIAVVEATVVKDSVKVLADEITVFDATSKDFSKTVSDAIAFAEVLAKFTDKTGLPADVISIVDGGITKLTDKVLADEITVFDATSKDFSKTVSDAIAFAEVLAKFTDKTGLPADVISIVDGGITKLTDKVLADVITVNEALTTIRVFSRTFAENISLSDSVIRTQFLTLTDSFSIVDIVNTELKTFLNEMQKDFDTILSDVPFEDEATWVRNVNVEDEMGRQASTSETFSQVISLMIQPITEKDRDVTALGISVSGHMKAYCRHEYTTSTGTSTPTVGDFITSASQEYIVEQIVGKYNGKGAEVFRKLILREVDNG